MNLVKRWFSALTTKKLQRSAHRSVKELVADVKAWAAAWNENPKPDELRRLDVLVHASTIPEPFGQVVVEGMATGSGAPAPGSRPDAS